jgi:hypothetical protein
MSVYRLLCGHVFLNALRCTHRIQLLSSIIRTYLVAGIMAHAFNSSNSRGGGSGGLQFEASPGKR